MIKAKVAKTVKPVIIEDIVETKQSAVAKIEIKLPVKDIEKKKPKVSGYVEAAGRTDFLESENTEKSYSTDLEFSLGYNFTQKDRV